MMLPKQVKSVSRLPDPSAPADQRLRAADFWQDILRQNPSLPVFDTRPSCIVAGPGCAGWPG
jgi:hypothetical protein